MPLIAGVLGPWGTAAAPVQAVDLLLMFAVDASDSITPEKARLQRSGYIQAIADPAVIAAIGKGRHASIAVSYLEWASPDEQFQIVGWTRIADAAGARAFGDALRKAPYEYGYWTSISGAIDRSAALIDSAPFTARRRVIDLSSDGRNNRGGPVLEARARALTRGITINGLIVLTNRRNFTLPPQPHLDRYFDNCVIGGPGAFTQIAEGPDDIVRALRRKLIREIADAPPHRRRAAIPRQNAVLLVSDPVTSGTVCD